MNEKKERNCFLFSLPPSALIPHPFADPLFTERYLTTQLLNSYHRLFILTNR